MKATTHRAKGIRMLLAGAVEVHVGAARDSFARHFHDDFDVILVESGTRRLEVSGAVERLGAGDVAIVEPGVPHRGESHDGWGFRSLYLPASVLREAARDAGARGEPGFRRVVPGAPRVAAQIIEATEAIERDATQLEVSSLFFALTLALLRESDARWRAGHTTEARHEVRRAQEYIHAHVAEAIDLDTLAVVAGLSKFHFLRAFRAETGLTPHAYQVRVRLDWAKLLLAAGRPPAVVAQEVGFADQSHLNRVFRRVVGVTPGAYQRAVAPSRA